MHISGSREDAFYDLKSRDTDAEIEWFAKEFDVDIQVLRRQFNLSGWSRWGLIKHVS